jgi:glycerophosphoryl diester phosphodiesterase
MTAIWSHRGIREGSPAPENTPAAFAAASATGVEGIELDVWRVAGGGFLVHHDREVPGTGAIDALAATAPGGLPTLEDALAACDVAVVNVELKVPPEATGATAGRLGAALADYLAAGVSSDRAELVVSSFSPDALTGFRDRSRLAVGLLTEDRPGPEELDEVVRRGWQAVHVRWGGCDRLLLSECTARGLALVVWTIDDDDGLRAALHAPLRAVITERPLRALELRVELHAEAAP